MRHLRDRKLEVMHRHFGIATGICSNCPHFRRYTFDKTYFKCEAYGLSHSEATDWRAKWQACGLINEELPDRWIPMIDKLEWTKEYTGPIDGQISLFDAEGEANEGVT